jgi:hypothetical protein
MNISNLLNKKDCKLQEKIDKLLKIQFYYIILLLAGIFLVVGTLFNIEYFFFDKHSVFGSKINEVFELLCTELGIAFCVIGVLGLTLDKHQKNKQEEMLNKFIENSFFAIYGWIIPSKKYLETVVSQIFNSNFIRTNWNITYTISKIPQNILDEIKVGNPTFTLADPLLMEIETSYTMTNIKAYGQEFNPMFSIEREDAPNFNKLIFFGIKIESSNIDIKFENEELDCTTILTKEEINNKYNLPKYLIKSEETAQVNTYSHAVRSINQTTEFFTTLYLSEGIKIKVIDKIREGHIFVCEAHSPHSCTAPLKVNTNYVPKGHKQQ